jgi:hypothetical protein
MRYALPDSVKAIQWIADLTIAGKGGGLPQAVGITTPFLQITLQAGKKDRSIRFQFPKEASVVAEGIDVKPDGKGSLSWKYDWEAGQTYRLALVSAPDSAGHFALYSAYVWLPELKGCKLLGTCQWKGHLEGITAPAMLIRASSQKAVANAGVVWGGAWVQRTNGSWKGLNDPAAIPPVVNMMSHIDSAANHLQDSLTIAQALAGGKTDATNWHNGIYYRILEPGAGRQVMVTDTVVVHYKGYLFPNGEIFDQTRELPASFPLGRLIKGWQVGVPLVKTGGKIKLVIPSGMAYSIRTRSPKIPPNSILTFEITVVEARPQ